VQVFSFNPARLFGLYPQKGTIAADSDADIVVFDPNKDVTIHRSDMHSRQDWELLEGVKVKGWPTMTLGQARRGKLAAKAQAIHGDVM
jgi:dihydropyrimidinase